MKFLEYEAKSVFKRYNIPVGYGFSITNVGEIDERIYNFDEKVVIKAQVDVGGRGNAGGVVVVPKDSVREECKKMFARKIKGLAVEKIYLEEALPIEKEYYVSITFDRSEKKYVIIFCEEGGVDIETVARENPDAIRKVWLSPLMHDIPQFMLKELLGRAPKDLAPVINQLYQVFVGCDAILAEINPLVVTSKGIYAADAKLIVDDNALYRQGIEVNRDLTEREIRAERYGFSCVELGGNIGVIGNGAGLTMSTLDIIENYGGKAANFLDVGGGASEERVMQAVKLVSEMPNVKIIIVNLLGGITRCDEVARGIVKANVPQRVILRIAGTNEEEGKKILNEHGYTLLPTMDDVIKYAVKEAKVLTTAVN